MKHALASGASPYGVVIAAGPIVIELVGPFVSSTAVACVTTIPYSGLSAVVSPSKGEVEGWLSSLYLARGGAFHVKHALAAKAACAGGCGVDIITRSLLLNKQSK